MADLDTKRINYSVNLQRKNTAGKKRVLPNDYNNKQSLLLLKNSDALFFLLEGNS